MREHSCEGKVDDIHLSSVTGKYTDGDDNDADVIFFAGYEESTIFNIKMSKKIFKRCIDFTLFLSLKSS